jgi:glutamyl-Q tRNA(Asp) synthetase
MPPVDLSKVPPRPVTRFAPSPTGYLHLGHVANAVWTWGIAGALGGRVLLRIEDHDRGRSRPEFERAIVEDLEWLGLVPGGERRVLRQSDHDRAYGRAALHLGRQSPVYACRCSRADIAQARTGGREDGRTGGREDGEELRYPGTCRTLRLAPADGLGLRVTLGDEAVEFEDLRLGAQRQTPALQCGDLLLRDAHGNWTYQLCVAVDDTRQAVNLVIRGEDLLASTGRQIMLAGRLGRKEPPLFLHHPLITDPEGRKLSKRDGSTGVRELRAAGKTPEEVLGEAAFRTGLIAGPRPVAAGDLRMIFT